MLVEGLVAKNMVNNKMEVESFSAKLFGVELQQASYADGSLFFHFSYSNISFNAPNKCYVKPYPSKEQKKIKEKKTNKKSDLIL